MYFKIHKDGWVFIISAFIISFITFPFFQIIGILFAILGFFIIYFFRDPNRSIPIEDFIVSPADGKIVYIGESNLPDELGITGDYLKISIFLDVFNVHVNRMPVSGNVKQITYIPGKFFRANVDKASKENERNIILLENKNKEKIVVVQIAGLIARRIVCELKNNQSVFKGDRFGMIKFGSRVDLYLPKNYLPLVSNDQIVIAGETIISNPNEIKKISKSQKI